MRFPEPGTDSGMGTSEYNKKKPPEERTRPQASGVPSEEGVTPDDFAERVDLDPGEQPNRPDQADWDEGERRQYDDQPVARTVADSDR